MAKVMDFLCMEQSTYPAVSSKVLDDHRRLIAYLKQEERFMPNNYQMRKTVDDSMRTKMLESIYEVRICSSSCFVGTLLLKYLEMHRFSSVLVGTQPEE